MTVSADVDFIMVCFRNDPADLNKLASILLAGATLAGRSAQVTFVVNDDAPLAASDGIRIIAGQGNIGFGAGINAGVRTTVAPYVVLVNPDCEPDDNAIAEFLTYLVPGCGLLTPLIVDGNGRADYEIYEQWTFTPARRVSAEVCARHLQSLGPEKTGVASDLPRFAKLPGTFVGAETTVARELDAPFSEDFFLYGEDRDLTIRARRAGIPVRLVRDVRIHHIGGVSGGRSEAISKCKADSLIRIAHRRYGRIGVYVAILDMWCVARLGRGQISREAAGWAARRWRRQIAPGLDAAAVGLGDRVTS